MYGYHFYLIFDGFGTNIGNLFDCFTGCFINCRLIMAIYSWNHSGQENNSKDTDNYVTYDDLNKIHTYILSRKQDPKSIELPLIFYAGLILLISINQK